MQPCDALRIALLTRDGAEIRHWLDDGSLVMIRCAKDALRIRALVRSEGLTCATYAARLDEAQVWDALAHSLADSASIDDLEATTVHRPEAGRDDAADSLAATRNMYPPPLSRHS